MSRLMKTIHFLSKNSVLFKNDLRVLQGLSLVCGRNYALKYVDPTRYNIDHVKVIKDEDPLAVNIIEKHGKAWHICEEGRNASIAHTVSGDFDLNNGLLREMSLYFADIINQEELESRKSPLGSIVPIKNGDHFLYFLVIRENWWDRGAYRPMRESLEALRVHALNNNVKTIAIGRLGSQNDGLDFGVIIKDIKKIFYDSGITLIIYPRRT
ncbi:ADP-ribose glycohydrolase OARD1 isoform X1 [Hydra vulgaris]|uniref:ADP-ribose glycohydrolase OARD1 isoform X1 n=1 Tax=Hydra vulgaris TaxID=6087 RepID=UPI0002B4A22B|nr:ADP-ribose glycohydrolase OARD1 [Hydra vulgaris]